MHINLFIAGHWPCKVNIHACIPATCHAKARLPWYTHTHNICYHHNWTNKEEGKYIHTYIPDIQMPQTQMPQTMQRQDAHDGHTQQWAIFPPEQMRKRASTYIHTQIHTYIPDIQMPQAMQRPDPHLCYPALAWHCSTCGNLGVWTNVYHIFEFLIRTIGKTHIYAVQHLHCIAVLVVICVCCLCIIWWSFPNQPGGDYKMSSMMVHCFYDV